MYWIILALIPPALFALINLLDSKIRNKYLKNDLLLTSFAGFIGLLIFILVPFVGITYPGPWIFTLSIICGMLYIYAMIPYFKALSFEDASIVVTLWFITPIIIPFLANIFLDEKLKFIQYIGFFIVVVAGILISIKKNSFNKFHISKALFLMLFAGLILNTNFILEKYIYQNQSFLNGFMWIRFGSFLGALTIFLFPKPQKAFLDMKKNIKLKPFLLILFGEILVLIGILLTGYVLSIQSATLVISIANFQPLFILLYAFIFSKFFPGIYKEEFNKKTLLIKIISGLLFITGFYLIGFT